MFKAYLLREQNLYQRCLGKIGQQKFIQVLPYILQCGTLPKPIILLETKEKKYDIIDGNHRFLALKLVRGLHAQLEDSLKLERIAKIKVLKEKFNIEKIVPLLATHETWVASSK